MSWVLRDSETNDELEVSALEQKGREAEGIWNKEEGSVEELTAKYKETSEN